MSEIFRQWLRLINVRGVSMQDMVDFHVKHKDIIVKELQDSWANEESRAAFQAEVERIRGGAQ